MHHFLFVCLFALSSVLAAQMGTPPNVLLILTDDQGYGDLGYQGNSVIRTPVLDSLAAESVRFANFYVSPVCAPTRASLMTGRYSLRTGVRDTYNGGAIMAGSEVTLAEVLRQAGYRTGIFGKWHLGDNYPGRPSDQGFDESLIHLAGGMGQPGDFLNYFRGDSSYFDPVLWHNNEPEKYAGYCSDIFAGAARDFIARADERPFFCYLSFNAPHTPLQVKAADYARYAEAEVTLPYGEPTGTEPPMSEGDVEAARRVYAMVTNIDDNLRRVFRTLDSLEQRENTIVIFMTDNGPQQYRYKGGLRGRKSDVYEGGVRVPFFLRYPKRYAGGTTITVPAAHLDVLPTLTELCGATLPQDRAIDGISLVPALGGNTAGLSDRSLFSYWTRKYPVPYRNMSLLRDGYKLVGQVDYDAPLERFALYDLRNDAAEQDNRIDERPELGQELRDSMDGYYRELIESPNLRTPPRILVDSTEENPLYLNRNDAAGQREIWTQDEVYGLWALEVVTPGAYTVRAKFIDPQPPGGTMYLELGTQLFTKEIQDTTDLIELTDVMLERGPVDLIPIYKIGGRRVFPLWVRLGSSTGH
ncbi:arylsulfatase [Neolewinella sp.]|uniref:arylsulfatase n=1 Tax=Neolewinella sp. TaxID=2993543 RepID=UPI003B52C3D6